MSTSQARRRPAQLLAVASIASMIVAGTGSIAAADPENEQPGTARSATADATPTTTTAESTTTTTTVAVGSDDDGDGCAAVHMVLVNGTGDADRLIDPDMDSGFFSQVAIPATQASGGTVARTYVPYPASFGGKPGDRDSATYKDSVLTGIANTTDTVQDIAAECPDTQFFLAGYSQGAQVVSAVARDIGAGAGPVDPARLAGAALLSDPTRGAGDSVFPGAPSNRTPDPAPGTDGANVAEVEIVETSPADGAGIAPNTSATDFGAVTGRVASFCMAGDLACDTPADAPLARLIANVAGQSSLDVTGDPVGVISDVATALGTSTILGGTTYIAETVDFNGSHFTVSPTSDTMLGRIAHYSDPQTHEEGFDAAFGALTKIAGMGLGAGIAVVRDVLAPDAIASYISVGLANPAAAGAAVLARAGEAALNLIPPPTMDAGVKLVINEVNQGVTDNAGLARMAVDTKYWDTFARHGSYNSHPVGVAGEPATELIIRWVTAIAADLGADGIDLSGVLDRSGVGQILGTSTTVSASDILA